jgi:hypothetical protein
MNKWLVYLEVGLPAHVLMDAVGKHAEWLERNHMDLYTNDAGGIAVEVQMQAPDIQTAVTQATEKTVAWMLSSGYNALPEYVHACMADHHRIDMIRRDTEDQITIPKGDT